MRSNLLLSLLLTSCGHDPDPKATAGAATGSGIFAEGCPVSDRATARRIGVDSKLPGKTAVGTKGDYLIMNGQAAYVITEPDTEGKGSSTYYYYGGVVADASPMSDCVPGDDKLDEVGLVLGALDITDINASILRGFKGESAEILADGSDGGPAVVRVTGTDAPYWLVEYTLIRNALDDGGSRPLSGDFGTTVQVDYVLEPDSPVLEIQITVTDTGQDDLSLLAASLLSTGETLPMFGYASGSVSVSGFGMQLGIPWLVGTDGVGALAYGVQDGNLGTTNISGVQVALDVNQALSDPIQLSPGQSDTRVFYLSVGPTDGPSATQPLGERSGRSLPAGNYSLEAIKGAVSGPEGPLAGATVTLQASTSTQGWGALDEATTDDNGNFTLYTPVFSDPWSWRVIASADGRDDSDPVEVSPGDEGISLSLGGEGALDYALTDDEGAPSPGRLHLVRDDGSTDDLWLADSGTAPLAPGHWSWTLTRGYEFEPVTGELTVPDGGSASLSAALSRVVDTSGWMSVDTHVHSSYSTDSDISGTGQLQHAAAHGLEVVVHTEHENIVDQHAEPAEGGVDAWVNNVVGEEVTASVPEHLTMFPSEADGTARGGFIQWYGMDLDELFGAMRERSGGGINLLNHPSYLNSIGWDRIDAQATLEDPTLLGLSPDAALWSWDLDGIEVMNGHASPFMQGNHRFDNWESMLNAGHPLVAVGCSDDHGGWEVGFPRSYWASPTDDPADFEVQDLEDAFLAGQVEASTGAFARVQADGTAGMGDLLTDTDGSVDLWVQVQAIPEIDVTHVVVFVNCDQVLSVAADEPDGVLKLEDSFSIPVDGDSALVIAAFGEGYLPLGMPQFDPSGVPRVLTSAIYVDGDGDGLFTAPGGRECSYDLAKP